MSNPKPLNLSAQLHYRARGNPPNTVPSSAISNCFPGLEFDFRAIWRRILVGIVLVENNNYVIDADTPELRNELVGHRLLRIDGNDVDAKATGPLIPGRGAVPLATAGNNPVAFMEWSNTIALILQKQGQLVSCDFTKDKSDLEVLPQDQKEFLTKRLELRRIFQPAVVGGKETVVINQDLLEPGELSQGLCSPWQNDYRECACYYWAASRPDYVNVEPAEDGASHGDNWMQNQRTGEYVLDTRKDSRLITYDDLFTSWEKVLQFQIQGKDAKDAPEGQHGKAERKQES
jgi:hypothetical protein